MEVSYSFNDALMTFDCEENEKVFALLGTKFGDGENYVRLATESELEGLGYLREEWDKDVLSMEIGECATYGYWFYDKANLTIRLA